VVVFFSSLIWSLLQDRNFAHLFWSRRRTWRTLEKKRKIFYEANRGVVCHISKQIARRTFPEAGSVEKSLSYQARRELPNRGHLSIVRQAPLEQRHAVIENACQAKLPISIRHLCELLQVNRAWYYARQHIIVEPSKLADAQLPHLSTPQ
jgi:hypothetical protein